QRAQLLRWNHDRLDRFLGVGIDQRLAARQLGQLAQEPAAGVGDDQLTMTELVAPSDDDLARQDEDQPVTDLADLREGLARAIRPELPEPAQPVDLRRLEGREHLLPAGFDQRALRRRQRDARRYARADGVGRACRRDGEDADISALAEMSAVRTRCRVMARRVRADDRAGALWHRHCSDDRPIASSAATHSRLMARPLLS